LSGIETISLDEIQKALVEDNTRIAEMLQLVFELNSYKKDFVQIPREHAVAVLNLTHYVGQFPAFSGGLLFNHLYNNLAHSLNLTNESSGPMRPG
jgi:hypothetical protein